MFQEIVRSHSFQRCRSTSWSFHGLLLFTCANLKCTWVRMYKVVFAKKILLFSWCWGWSWWSNQFIKCSQRSKRLQLRQYLWLWSIVWFDDRHSIQNVKSQMESFICKITFRTKQKRFMAVCDKRDGKVYKSRCHFRCYDAANWHYMARLRSSQCENKK